MKNSYNRIVVGNIVPMLTYFNEEGIIDEVSCKLQALHILSNGGDAIFLLGSTGEGIYIKNISVKNPDERFKLVLSVIDAIIQYQFLKKKFIPILIGTYGESFSEVLEEIELYQKSIISYLKENEFNYKFIIKFLEAHTYDELLKTFIYGYVIPPPKYKTLSESELLKFYESILSNIKDSIYLYNNPNSFANNIISNDIIEKLLKFNNLKGIKDSSDTLDQKLKYFKFLSESFSVSCGKEGIIGTFLKNIPHSLRKFTGIVPSFANLTNICKNIYEYSLNDKIKEMIQLQEEMNRIRNKIYDSTINKGKAQRGLKICFRKLYVNLYDKIPIMVSPEFKREIPIDIINQMYENLNYCLKNNYIYRVQF